LFKRNARGVSLTDAGQELVACAKRVLDSMRDLNDRMLSYKHGFSGELQVGIVGSYSWLPVLRKIFDKLKELGPDLRVHLQPQMSLDQLESIRTSVLDGGILTWRPRLDNEFQGFPIFRDRWAVAVPKSLAVKYTPGTLYLKDFREESFIMFPRNRSPATFDVLSELFDNASFKPTVSQTVADMPTMMGLVSSGIGCAIVPESFKKQAPEDVMVFPFMDKRTSIDLEFVWRSGNTNVLLTRFIDAARSVLAEEGPVS